MHTHPTRLSSHSSLHLTGVAHFRVVEFHEFTSWSVGPRWFLAGVAFFLSWRSRHFRLILTPVFFVRTLPPFSCSWPC